jgi:hypothetical protein
LHAYMATVLQNLNCHPVLINSVEDHIHLLFELRWPRKIGPVAKL